MEVDVLLQEFFFAASILDVVGHILGFFQVSYDQIDGSEGSSGNRLLVRVLAVDDGGVGFASLVVYRIPNLAKISLSLRKVIYSSHDGTRQVTESQHALFWCQSDFEHPDNNRPCYSN